MKRNRVLLVIAPRNFRDEEYFETRHILEAAGYKVDVASTQTGPVRGSQGGWTNAELLLAQARVADYDAVVFIGGWGALVLHDDLTAQRLAKQAFEQGRVVGAICVAPVVLAKAGLLAGKKATCYPSEASKLRQAGANYTGELVEVQGRIITGSGPEAASEFGRRLVGLLEAQGGGDA